jgi:hypothetical protein
VKDADQGRCFLAYPLCTELIVAFWVGRQYSSIIEASSFWLLSLYELLWYNVVIASISNDRFTAQIAHVGHLVLTAIHISLPTLTHEIRTPHVRLDERPRDPPSLLAP